LIHRVWYGVGSMKGGIFKFDPETEEFINYYNIPGNPFRLSDNCVRALCFDRFGTLWIGTMYGGLNKFIQEEERFIHYTHEPNNPYSISSNYIYSIYEDNSGDFWIGTNNGGLNKFDRKNERFIHYQNNPGNKQSICDTANELRYLLFDLSDFLYPYSMNTYLLRNNEGTGIWEKTFPAEDSIFSATDSLLAIWRSGTFSLAELLLTENKFANYALNILNSCYISVVSIGNDKFLNGFPSSYTLNQNYPNPFNPTTNIEFQIPKSEFVTLTIYNVKGQKVKRLLGQRLNPGVHQCRFDGNDLSSGIYYYQLTAGEYQSVKKMILLR
jgi:hypothetical protein